MTKTLKNLYAWINNYYALTTPRYSRVGEHRVDCEIEKLELIAPKNSPRERDTMGDILHMDSFLKNQVNMKINPLCRK